MEFLQSSTAAILEIIDSGFVVFNIVWGTVFGD
jgi:hypothetical protein